MVKILFVCTGNICRSPTGEGVFRSKLEKISLTSEIQVDSCGIMGWHTGKEPDARSQKAAASRYYDLSKLRARQIKAIDFEEFDFLLGMDKGHFDEMQAMAPAGTAHKVHLFLEPVSGEFGTIEVPDPYYGGSEGFELVLDMIERGSDAWITELLKK